MDAAASVARVKGLAIFGVPGIRTWFDVTYIAGLREARMPEE